MTFDEKKLIIHEVQNLFHIFKLSKRILYFFSCRDSDFPSLNNITLDTMIIIQNYKYFPLLKNLKNNTNIPENQAFYKCYILNKIPASYQFKK